MYIERETLIGISVHYFIWFLQSFFNISSVIFIEKIMINWNMGAYLNFQTLDKRSFYLQVYQESV